MNAELNSITIPAQQPSLFTDDVALFDKSDGELERYRAPRTTPQQRRTEQLVSLALSHLTRTCLLLAAAGPRHFLDSRDILRTEAENILSQAKRMPRTVSL